MLDDIVAQHPVVMFVLEWCEFSWSVRKLFAAAGVPYQVGPFNDRFHRRVYTTTIALRNLNNIRRLGF